MKELDVDEFKTAKERQLNVFSNEISELDIEATLMKVSNYLVGTAFDFQEDDLEKANRYLNLRKDVALLHYKLLPKSDTIFLNVSLDEKTIRRKNEPVGEK